MPIRSSVQKKGSYNTERLHWLTDNDGGSIHHLKLAGTFLTAQQFQSALLWQSN